MNKTPIANLRYKTYLLENKISNKEEAKKINCSQSTFSHKLNRKGSSFTLPEVSVISQSHNMTIEQMFGDSLV